MTVKNTVPKFDASGNIVDAHDGRVIQFGDTFYWYGTSYGNTNGFTTANRYVCYSSKDLKTWKKVGALLRDQPEGVYYRPHVIYNAKTEKYVLWYNWYPQLWNGQFGVALSDTPEGPFTIIKDNVKMARSELGLGDFGLFVDDDNIAYISYNTINNHQVSIEKLSADYLSSTMENGGVISEHMEAGSQFKRNGKYYLLTDYTCCFCNYGSGARVYISDNPLTGYTLTTNINRYPGRFAPLLHDGIARGTAYETLKKVDGAFESAESTFHNERSLKGIVLDVFTGNRPENCGDVSNPRVHPEITTPEFKVYQWDFGQWKEVQITTVQVEKSALREHITLQFDTVKTNRIKITPSNKNGAEAIYINEVKFEAVANSAIMGSYITGVHIAKNPIIPAQQTYVMKLKTSEGEQFLWMGDLWGSASDNIKGHDYQYWSKPLEFYEYGTIKPLEWVDSWSFTPDKN
ncbi:family 43 glycosylhydrolase [Poritiphilus flavus]|uniref:Family 43 glycosylhydrolase n=1 Tax=Poritiphilus flavus TaxID=2697053 RepID=A0A6L9E7W9_9FLAO|nr:family 43 glycosylhydrolase [Poritiphilus flavus]NAS10539.1 family 43 glycosylhydrolase [Poritiphilus flavus]